ncbi:hypothetical protein ABLO26_24465 [Neobacillus sp. 179-J 1A1 HS]|uniref:hypothetical protein n=1 Tax=Neobacillus driksii TaxID=3035913 RepID=UPI0035BC41CF
MENGESLLVSWLRDSKNCQITQTHWKVSSSSWVLHNEDTIEEVITSLHEFFSERFNYTIFNNTKSFLKSLQRSEIDVLGLEILSGIEYKLYGINSDFNDVGQNAKNITPVIERILINMTRTAMLIHGFYNLSKGSIIFAAPKINKAIVKPLTETVKVLNELFKVFGFQFNFILFLNEEYRDQIISHTETFASQVKVVVSNNKNTIVATNNQEYFRKVHANNKLIEIGLLVRSVVRHLAGTGQLTDETIQQLLDKRYSKENFDLSTPLLKHIKKETFLEDPKNIEYERYSGSLYSINGRDYLICKDWDEEQRSFFLKWLEQLMVK